MSHLSWLSQTQEMKNGSLSKMGFTKINGKWVSKDGDHGASSSAAAADSVEEDQAADMDFHHEEQPETNLGAGTSARNQGDEMPSMSSFEKYMVNKLDGFAENQRNLHDLCLSNFQSIDNRFNSMDTQIMTLDVLKMDEAHLYLVLVCLMYMLARLLCRLLFVLDDLVL